MPTFGGRSGAKTSFSPVNVLKMRSAIGGDEIIMIGRFQMTKWLPLVPLLSAWGWALPALAGVRIESKVTAYENQPVETTLELQGNAFRVDRGDGASQQIPSTTI